MQTGGDLGDGRPLRRLEQDAELTGGQWHLGGPQQCDGEPLVEEPFPLATVCTAAISRCDEASLSTKPSAPASNALRSTPGRSGAARTTSRVPHRSQTGTSAGLAGRSLQTVPVDHTHVRG